MLSNQHGPASNPVSCVPGHLDAPAHLLCLQGEFNKDLLEFLIDKVDAELLKAVFLWREEKSASFSGLMLEAPRAMATGSAPGSRAHTWKISKP